MHISHFTVCIFRNLLMAPSPSYVVEKRVKVGVRFLHSTPFRSSRARMAESAGEEYLGSIRLLIIRPDTHTRDRFRRGTSSIDSYEESESSSDSSSATLAASTS